MLPFSRHSFPEPLAHICISSSFYTLPIYTAGYILNRIRYNGSALSGNRNLQPLVYKPSSLSTALHCHPSPLPPNYGRRIKPGVVKGYYLPRRKIRRPVFCTPLPPPPPPPASWLMTERPGAALSLLFLRRSDEADLTPPGYLSDGQSSALSLRAWGGQGGWGISQNKQNWRSQSRASRCVFPCRAARRVRELRILRD